MILNRRLNDAGGLGSGLRKLAGWGRTDRPAGVLLTGPRGAGKHNAAWHLLQALDEADWAPVFLTGAGLSEDVKDHWALSERLNALLDCFYERHQSLCMVVEEPDGCIFASQLYDFLGRTAAAYKTYPDGDPELLLILMSEQQPMLTSLLRDQLLACPCDLPTEAQRGAFLDERGRMIRNYVSLKQLAAMTEGCSYADLGRLVEQLGFQIDVSGHAPDEETLKRGIRQLSPAATAAAPQSQPSAAVVDVLTRIETALNGLAERLGKIRLSSPEAQQFAPQSFVQQNLAAQSAVPQDPDRKSIENLSIRQLTTELFNEDQARELLLN